MTRWGPLRPFLNASLPDRLRWSVRRMNPTMKERERETNTYTYIYIHFYIHIYLSIYLFIYMNQFKVELSLS